MIPSFQIQQLQHPRLKSATIHGLVPIPMRTGDMPPQ
jgi:hypothetical protein